jgi:ADP-ribose pyrophosphatase YjhB (NUDIX family)
VNQALKLILMDPAINFCCHCAAPVKLRIPAGDSLPRHVCDACGAIHYRNPRLVVGALPVWEDKVLLCRRAIEPRRGCWTLPAGFMENQETVAEAALRETREEACANIELGAMYTMISVPHISQVHVIYWARLLDLDFAPGEETLEVALFNEAAIPWEGIAFRTGVMTLRHFFADRANGNFDLHVESVILPK